MKTVCVTLLLSSVILESGSNRMPWDKWTWSMPQGPIEYFFRRQDNLPIKAPTLECECPPHKECAVEFKINQDMADFLNIRGIIKKEELVKFREDLKRLEGPEGAYIGDEHTSEYLKRKRRSGDEESNCCCPPKNVFMPAFITEHKFHDIAGDCFKPPIVIQPVIIRLLRYPNKIGKDLKDQINDLNIAEFLGR